MLFAVSVPLLRPRIPVGRARSTGDDASKRDHSNGGGDQKKVWKSVRLWMFLFANGNVLVRSWVPRDVERSCVCVFVYTVAQVFGFFLPMLFVDLVFLAVV